MKQGPALTERVFSTRDNLPPKQTKVKNQSKPEISFALKRGKENGKGKNL